MSAPILEARLVTKRFGGFEALHDVSLSVRPGEIVGLVGGNGAGKTTLMRILLGVERPSSGDAALFDAAPTRTARRRVGYVAQGLGLYPTLSARENLEFTASVHGCEVGAEAVAFAARFGRRPVAEVPLGAQRMLAYLAATLHRPELLILDEPTSGMDPLARQRLWDRLRATSHEAGILVTTHYLREAARCDRLVMLTRGRVVGTGTAAELVAGTEAIVVAGDAWNEAFLRLRAAGIPVALDGRELRVAVRRDETDTAPRGGATETAQAPVLPDASTEAIRAALGDLADDFTLRRAPATLEEVMVLAATPTRWSRAASR